MPQKVGKYDAEFRLQRPETIGETDRAFDLLNYVDFLENKIEQNAFDMKTIDEKKRVALLQKVVEQINGHIRKELLDLILETKLEV